MLVLKDMSSVHEVLIVPDSAGIDAESLRAMVKEANSTVVMPREILSDNVYHYDPEDRSLSTVKATGRGSRITESGRF